MFGTTPTKLRNRVGTSTLSSLAELKMHIRGEHQEKSKKTRMKNLFGHRSRTSPTDPAPAPATTTPESHSWTHRRFVDIHRPRNVNVSTSGLRHLIPDDVEDSEPYHIGRTILPHSATYLTSTMTTGSIFTMSTLKITRQKN